MTEELTIEQSREATPFVWLSGDDDNLYEMDISAITALTRAEVESLLRFLANSGYQWETEIVCSPFGGHEDYS